MPRSSREEMQDRALAKMDKINRNRPKEENKPLTLAEQLSRLEKEKKLSPEEKLRRMSYGDWIYELREYVRKEKFCITRIMNIIESKNRKDMESFHLKGTPFRDIGKWISEESIKYL